MHINSDKTNLLLVHRPKHSKALDNFKFMADIFEIKPKKSIKILGFILSSDLKLDRQVGKLCSQLHNRIYQLSLVGKFMNFGTRCAFIKSYVLGKLQYGLPLYLGMKKELVDKFHKIIMRSARTIIGSYCFKKSKKYILSKCKILPIEEYIVCASLKLIYNIFEDKSPRAIIDLFHEQHIRTKKVELRPLYNPRTALASNFYIQKVSIIFNNLPDDIKCGSNFFLAKKIKTYIENNYWDDKKVT